MSQATDDLKGSLVALVTPMQTSGAVDWAALDGLVDWHLQSGTHGLVPVGTTGESATLTHAEHNQVIAAVVRRVTAAGRDCRHRRPTQPPKRLSSLGRLKAMAPTTAYP